MFMEDISCLQKWKYPPCKILKIVLGMEKRRTLTNGRKDKKPNDDAEGLQLRDDIDRL